VTGVALRDGELVAGATVLPVPRDLEYANAEVLRPYLERAKSVHVEADGEDRETVEVGSTH
jgi:hypothetical protein